MQLIEYVKTGKRKHMHNRYANPLVKMGLVRIVGEQAYQTRDMRASSTLVETRDDTQALREQYQAIFGKRPFMGWDSDTLRQKIEQGPE